MEEKKKKVKENETKHPTPCPSMSGEMIGYRAQCKDYKRGKSVWKDIPINKTTGIGVPSPPWFRGVHHDLGMQSRSGAMAIAWWFKSFLENSSKEIRVVPYHIAYKMEARIQEHEAILIEDSWTDKD